MLRATWDDLSDDERRWLFRLANHSAAMLTVAVADRLEALGLGEEKLGGTGISRAGEELIAQQVGRRAS